MSNPITVTVSESNVSAGASVTVTVLNAAPASGAGKTIVSAGGIADLTTTQQGEVSQGVIVVTTDGLRYIYSGAGSKTNPASYVLLADITPDWSTLSGKPTSFTPASHASAHGSAGADPVTVAVSQVTGLQTALDGKAASSHTHTAAAITDFTAAVQTAAPATTDASLLTSGTLADARLSANVVLTSDSRLSDARAPSAHAASHQTGGSDAIANVVTTLLQITADQNNYLIGSGDIFRISANAARNITGVFAGSGGQAVLLVNVGAFAITLKHQNASSTANNRLLVPWAGDYVMDANGGAALLVYDASDSRWRVV